MRDFDPDYQAGLEGRTHYAGHDTEAYKRGLADRSGTRSGAAMSDALGRGVGGIAGGPLGIMLIGAVLFFATIGVMISAAFFPVAGGLTIAVYLLLYNFVWPTFMKGVSEILALLIFLIPGGIFFFYAMKLEGFLARGKFYRWFRHVWRMAGFAATGWFIAMSIDASMSAPYAADAPLSQVFPWSERIVVVVCFVAGHFVSRWLDRKIKNLEERLRFPLPRRKKEAPKEERRLLPW